MAVDPPNDFKVGDLDYNILRKILARMLSVMEAIETVSPTVNIESGTVGVNNFPATQPVSGSVSAAVTGSVSVSNFPAILTTEDPLLSATRLGLVDGKAAEVFHVMGRRAGFNSTSVLQDIGEFLGTSINALPELTGAENLEIVSTSANDLAVSGSGARTIRVGYIDTSNNLVVSADLALNGTTAVALAFKANFILWMEVTASGNGEIAAGNILLRIAGAGATHEQITAGGNRSLSCRFMVPTGYSGYLVDWGLWAIGTTQDARLRATVRTRSRTLGTNYVFQSVAYLVAGGNTSEEIPYLKCPALSKIKISTISGAVASATNRIDGEFTILLISNT